MTSQSLTSELLTIENALRRLCRDAALKLLDPGLDAGQVAAALAENGVPLVPDVVALYGWRNGTSAMDVVLDDIHLFPGFYFSPLEESVANYRAFITDRRWTEGWLPVFANGGGDFYVVDTLAGGAVRKFRIDEVDHPIEFESLTDMARTLAAAFVRDIFFVAPEGYLEMDVDAFYDLAAELNPSVQYWIE